MLYLPLITPNVFRDYVGKSVRRLRMTRSEEEKSKHNDMVEKMAKEYNRKGYDVDADLEGWNRPKTIDGVRPDIRARKGGHETAVEVETPGTVGSKRDQKQHTSFKDWCKNNSKKHYRRIVTKKK